MEDNRYLDKVVGSMVRSTKIDYEKEIVSTPHFVFLFPTFQFYLLFSSFSKYCKNQFGLTDEEIDYVWNEYRSIILDKISKREP